MEINNIDMHTKIIIVVLMSGSVEDEKANQIAPLQAVASFTILAVWYNIAAIRTP
jgi:hypothetical protein